MSNVGFATLSVIPSFQGFQTRLSAGVAAPMASAGRNGGRKFGDAAGKEAGGRFRSGFLDRMKGFAPLAGLAAGAGAVAFFKSAIDGASDLSESGNKINAVFGKAQGAVQEFAAGSAEALGQTRLQALDAASTFGTFGKAAGLSGDALAGFSTELVQLSTDMASFYNTSVEDAIESIGSGLRGEAEPLRKFGVLLDDATLRQEALKQGLIQTTKQALNPQQKVLAAHAVIMQQTVDAQGDFERTSGGLANQQRILTAQWEEMKTAVGSELLPAMTGFVTFMNDDALPALGEVGGLAKDAAGAFSALPTPVKASAAAFVALRIAAATGLTTAAASGVASMSSAMVGLRLRTMLAADAFRAARAGSLTFAGNTGRFVAPVGRMSASLAGLRAAAAGAGASMRAGLGSVMGLLGGPWGVALIGATAVLGKFWAEHAKAKQQVDDLAASLDQQTGAITKNTRATVANRLEDEGALEAAQKLGISLEDMTSAALGNASALERVRDRIREVSPDALGAGQGMVSFDLTLTSTAKSAHRVAESIQDLGEDLDESKDKTGRLAQALGESKDTTDDAADATVNYASKLRDARDRVNDLIDAEEERRKNAVKNRRDQLALITTLADARKEAREGKKTLDENTKAGRENWEALLDVADQWNNSADKVRNARGAYKDMRQNFIELAEKMGATEKRAKALADRFLTLPDRKRLRIETPGMDEALSKLRLMRDLAAPGGVALETKLKGDPYGARLNGGPVSPGVPYIVGERRPEVFVPDRPGRIEPRVSGGNTYQITVVADDPWKFKRELEHMERAGALGGADFR